MKRSITYLLVLLSMITLVHASNFNITARNSVSGSYLANFTAVISYYDSSVTFFQEQSNVATLEGGLSTGNYSFSSSDPYFYINYSKPSLAYNATWQLKGGSAGNYSNFTLTSACWSAYTNIIMLRFYSTTDGSASLNTGNATNRKECYNGASWVLLGSETSSGTATAFSNLATTQTYDADYSTFAAYNNQSSFGSKGWKPTIITSTNNNISSRLFDEGVYWYAYNYTTITVNTTSSNLTVNISTTRANVTIISSGYAGTSVSNHLISGNYSANLSPVSLNFQFQDEDNLTRINWTTITGQVSSASYSFNFTTNNGTYSFNPIPQGNYSITYSSPTYNQRTYNFSVGTNNTTITLYLANSIIASNALFNVIDVLYHNVVPNAQIYVTRPNLTGIGYYTVETCNTDSNGECVVTIELVNGTSKPVYRILIYYTGALAYDSGDTSFTTNVREFAINIGTYPLGNVFTVQGSLYNLTETHTTAVANFNYNYVDVYDVFNYSCLIVKTRNYAQTTTLYNYCNGNNTGIISTTQSLQGQEVCAYSYVVYSDGTTETTGTPICLVNSQSTSNTGAKGLFYIVLPLFLTFIMIFRERPGLAVAGAGLVLATTFFIGILDTTSLAAGGLLIGVAAIYLGMKT